MTDQQKDDVGHAFKIVGKFLLTHGAGFGVTLTVMWFLFEPRISAYAEGKITEQTAKRFETVEQGLSDQAEATTKNTAATTKNTKAIEELTGAVDANTRALREIKETQDIKFGELIDLLSPPE